MKCEPVNLETLRELGFNPAISEKRPENKKLSGKYSAVFLDWDINPEKCEAIRANDLLLNELKKENPEADFEILNLSIKDQSELKELAHFHRAVVFPLFPQFSHKTTGKLVRMILKTRRKKSLTKITPPVCHTAEFLAEHLTALGTVLNSQSAETLRHSRILFLCRDISEKHGFTRKKDPFRFQAEKSADELMNLLKMTKGAMLPYRTLFIPSSLKRAKRKLISALFKEFASQGSQKIFVVYWDRITFTQNSKLESELKNLAHANSIDEIEFIKPFGFTANFIRYLGDTLTNEFKKFH